MSEFRKYGTDPKMDALVDSYTWVDRHNAAKQGYGLDILINDRHDNVRIAVARQGYGLDILINDTSENVRAVVADQGYGLDKLINDKHWCVRETVAKQGYGLDILINDPDWWIRKKVAEQGYGLDVLINNERWEIRAEVARHGYGLDKLINDKDWAVRRVVAYQGYGLDVLFYVYYSSVRVAVATQDYGLNILINDEHLCVRATVAERGYGLNVLVNDEDGIVRTRVSDYLKEHNYKSIEEWAATEPEKVHNADPQDFKVQEDLKDFIYKIDDSPKLKVESSYDSIDEFFNDCVSNSDNLDELIICTVDTKQPIIKIQKTLKENKAEFKFLVDITDEEGNCFLIQTIIKSKEQLNSKIQETVESLRSQKEFSKYADDLESCL